jgi:hypothetical protein
MRKRRANFESRTGEFENFTGGGADDFENKYSYDSLGDMTGILQEAQSPTDESTSTNDVASKYVALGYDSDSRLAGVTYYAGTSFSEGTSLFRLLVEHRNIESSQGRRRS